MHTLCYVSWLKLLDFGDMIQLHMQDLRQDVGSGSQLDADVRPGSCAASALQAVSSADGRLTSKARDGCEDGVVV